MLKRVAVTGGLSSGKSTVCHFFKEQGCYVLSADKIVHHLLVPSTPLGQKIKNLLGEDTIKDGRFDRSLIAKIVFNEPAKLQALEGLLFPAVRDEQMREYKIVSENKEIPLFVVEVPLLFESGSEQFFDKTIVVDAELTLAQQRFMESTKHPKEEFKKRNDRQMPLSEKKEKADYIIYNNGDLAGLKKQTEKIFKQLTS
jgi:dephospho-CoA kinase